MKKMENQSKKENIKEISNEDWNQIEKGLIMAILYVNGMQNKACEKNPDKEMEQELQRIIDKYNKK